MTTNSIPQHVAIIMDGNGRWAKSHNLSRTQGHIEGVRRVEEIIDCAAKLGVKVLTLYTFSTENWRRPTAEVSMLMHILTTVLREKINKLKRDNTRFQMIGRREGVPEPVLKALDNVVVGTKDNSGLILNLAFNYGSRLEILDAIQKIASDVSLGRLKPLEITEELISNELYTHGLPDPDLLIRTSGEKRLSNFLLWQCSYAEFYFTEKFWPDFNEAEFQKAIVSKENGDTETLKRKRRDESGPVFKFNDHDFDRDFRDLV
jgi:undecaprenyl diphosphate synthase